MTNDGVMISIRRYKAKASWETILGKSIPRYPLINHLIDTAALVEVLWEKAISAHQKNIIISGFSFTNQPENKEEFVKTFIKFAAGMHDIGKATPEWQVNTLKMQQNDESLQGLPVPLVVDHSSNKWKHDLNGGLFFEIPDNTHIQNMIVKQTLTSIVASHHGHYDVGTVIERSGRGDTNIPLWLEAQQHIEQQIAEIVTFDLNDNNVTSVEETAIVLVTGLVVLADWIVSRTEFMQELNDDKVPYSEHYANAKKLSYEYIDKFGLNKPEWKQNITWDSLFPHITQPNPFQQSFIENIDKISQTGLTLISAPMGIGKTETSLFLASKIGQNINNSGFWITLPTQATANSIFKRCTDIANKVYDNSYNSVSLMHGNSSIAEVIKDISKNSSSHIFTNQIINAPDTVDDSDYVSNGSKDVNPSTIFISDYLVEKKIGGMSSIAVSTVDQLISAGLPLKHNMLRWLAISGKTLIFDEIHDFDEYTFGIIIKTVEWCGKFGIPVIAMSATLSGHSQQELAKAYLTNAGYSRKEVNELIKTTIPDEGLKSPEWISYNSVNKTYHKETLLPQTYVPYNLEFHPTEDLNDTIFNISKNHLKHDANILITCHTVNQAIAVYRYLKTNINDSTPIGLIHSRMPETQKQKVIRNMLQSTGKPEDTTKPRSKQITVSTQIVQQSMDIDYDVLITLAAPLPEIFQRIGRIYRHNQGDKRAEFYNNNPYVHIIVEQGLQNYKTNPQTILPKAVVPYKEFDVLTSLHTLETKVSPTANKWNAKEDISPTFTQNYNLMLKYQVLPEYQKMYEKKNDLNLAKKNEQDRVSIKSPKDLGELIDSLNLTAPYTNRSSLAASTRLIDPNKEIIFVIEENNTIYIVEETDQNGNIITKTSIATQKSYVENIKNIGLNVLTVSQSFYKKYELGNYVMSHPSLEAFNRDTIFINYNEISLQADIKYDTENEGLSPTVLTSNDYLWI